MPTKKCYLCGRAQQIDDLDLTCPACHEKELDVLMAVYGFVHCYGSDYCPAGTVIRDLEPVGGVNASHMFLKSWIRKGWLEANEVKSVRVPPPVSDQLQEHGYYPNPAMRKKLDEQKEASRNKSDLALPMTDKPQIEKRSVHRMATINRRGSE